MARNVHDNRFSYIYGCLLTYFISLSWFSDLLGLEAISGPSKMWFGLDLNLRHVVLVLLVDVKQLIQDPSLFQMLEWSQSLQAISLIKEQMC